MTYLVDIVDIREVGAVTAVNLKLDPMSDVGAPPHTRPISKNKKILLSKKNKERS